MKRNKNFFYRINPHEVLAEVLFSENKEQWFLQFFDDLRKDDPGTATIPLAARIIEEAHNFREKRSIAGRASAEQRGNKGQQDATYVEHMLKDVQPVAVAVAVSSKEESKEKPKISSPSGDVGENAFDQKKAFELLWEKYPRKERRKEAWNHFKKSVKSKEAAKQMWVAMCRYMEDKKGTEPQFLQQGGTWFNNWEDWIPKGDV